MEWHFCVNEELVVQGAGMDKEKEASEADRIVWGDTNAWSLGGDNIKILLFHCMKKAINGFICILKPA